MCCISETNTSLSVQHIALPGFRARCFNYFFYISQGYYLFLFYVFLYPLHVLAKFLTPFYQTTLIISYLKVPDCIYKPIFRLQASQRETIDCKKATASSEGMHSSLQCLKSSVVDLFLLECFILFLVIDMFMVQNFEEAK